MNKILWQLSILLLCLAFVIFLDCKTNQDDDAGDDDTYQGDDDYPVDDDSNNPCLDNVAPELLGFNIFVNGAVKLPPLQIKSTDLLEFAISYNDPDCETSMENLRVYLNSSDSSWGDSYKFQNVACSTPSGEPLRFTVDPMFFFQYDSAPEFSPFTIYFEDGCDISNKIQFDIHVTEVPVDCDNNVPPQLLAVQVLDGGVPIEMGAPVECGDDLQLAIEYVDENCNLEGGEMNIRYVDSGETIGMPQEWTLFGVGCSSAEMGHPVTLKAPWCGFMPGSNPPFAIWFYDRCDNGNELIVDYQCPDCEDRKQ